MRKYILKILLLTLTIFTLTGCSISSLEKRAEALETLIYLATTPGSVDTAEEVLRCFDEDDVDGLKSLFCEQLISENLEKEIESAFNYYKGTSVSHGTINAPSEESVREGKIVKYHTSPHINKIKTDENIEYDIIIYMYRVNDKNPNYVGINMISVYTRDKEDELIPVTEIGKLLD